jgi:hypothetical protein
MGNRGIKGPFSIQMDPFIALSLLWVLGSDQVNALLASSFGVFLFIL